MLAFALAAVACDHPVPPAVAQRQLSLDAGDLAVMMGLLDDLRQQHPGVSFRVVDTTIAICDGSIEAVAPPPGGCLTQQSIDIAFKVLPAPSRVTAMLDFRTRNARRLPITGDLGGNVTRVSATFLDIGSAPDVVTVSAPSYPAPRLALIVYRTSGGEAAVRLAQQPDGRWVREKRAV